MYSGVTVRSEVNFLCPYLPLHENAMRTNVQILGICLQWKRQFHSLPVWKYPLVKLDGTKILKIQGDSCSFDFAESEYDNQIAPSTTNVKEKGIKLQN
jgi:hypothetical protein